MRARLSIQGGVLAPTDLLDLGVGRHHLDRAVREGELVRLRRDVLVDAVVWNAATPWERHELRARAVGRSKCRETGSPFALSHHSALALHTPALHGVDDRVHVVRTDGVRTHTGGMMGGHLPVDAEWVGVLDAIRTVDPALAALQVAAVFGVEAGLVSADAGLRAGLFTRQRLDLAASLPGFGPGRTAARLVAEHANGLRESAGESRTWWLFRLLGLPEPELQVVLRDERGRVIGRVDFLFRAQRTVAEFDGLLKYRQESDLRAEKVRQDRIVDLGHEVVRVVWADLPHPQQVHQRMLTAFARAARRYPTARRP